MNNLTVCKTIFAPAKVNIHLTIKNKRIDGFHNLESLFLAVDFGDFLHFLPVQEEKTIEITMKGEKKGKEYHSVPLKSNIIFKALSLFREKTGFFQGLKITVDKRIPFGSGLGGGSSNAAATLLALNQIAGSPLGQDSLLELGASLGSDVPFFLHKTTAAWVTGRGENIKPLDTSLHGLRRINLVLVNPGFPSDTTTAYRLLDEHRTNSGEPLDRHIPDIKNWSNDFLAVFPKREKSIYNEIISSLQECGAEFASLSGAGSTCFGVFGEKEQAQKAAQKAAESLRNKWDFVQVCRSYQFVHL
ncbi:MAG: 4-(cytidine 5'-diphospho)-2-C-methyl-D-erythritol kinase [Treponema sp.]|nr:4-(cytidine 5'-diphospho)-2-C-methyl-D-erythritol kinase [Treponema sp.]